MTTTLTTLLRIYDDTDPHTPILETSDGDRIAQELREIGIRFERWAADAHLEVGASQADALEAYRTSVERLTSECGFQSVDVLQVERGTPNTEPMRMKFFNEHRHSEDEVRFFIEGRGAFYLHVGSRVFQAICVKGDLISVPAGTTHWFDMGPDPEFTVIRFFVNPDGWVADFTGSSIAQVFPKFEV